MPTRTARLASATAIIRAAVGGGRRAAGRTIERVGRETAGRSNRRAAEFDKDARRAQADADEYRAHNRRTGDGNAIAAAGMREAAARDHRGNARFERMVGRNATRASRAGARMAR